MDKGMLKDSQTGKGRKQGKRGVEEEAGSVWTGRRAVGRG